MTGKAEIVLSPEMIRIGRVIKEAGGRAVAVGGFVRDHLMGLRPKDIDVEVFGLSLKDLENALRRFGEVHTVGRSFGVLQVKGLPVDFSLPRKDSKTGPGHKGFDITFDSSLNFEEASRRRDLTINSMGLDLASGEILDPHDGHKDLICKTLRATDPRYFSEDPLRGLRVVQFAARFCMIPNPELVRLCAKFDLSELPAERIFEEFRKLLNKGIKPSLGLEFLYHTKLLRFFPELNDLVGLVQDPAKHPEGSVWIHTLMVVDEAALLRDGGDADEALMFAALCHDLGKQADAGDDGRVGSISHEIEGANLAENFLKKLRAPFELMKAVRALVRHHRAPTLLVDGGAKPGAYRRLSRKLEAAGVRMETLARLNRADHLGRSTPEAKRREYPAGDRFMEIVHELEVPEQAPRDVVMGRHLIARGLQPGAHFCGILNRCREVQDETGWKDPERILQAVMDSKLE
jgi:tRNA nucleotidyltransferase (CCA-adding enzyme)